MIHSNLTIPLRIIVAGSRTYQDYATFRQMMDDYLLPYRNHPLEIITGRAKDGPDDMIYHYCRWDRNYPVQSIFANWNEHGKAAGMRRNIEMADYATSPGFEGKLICFWDKKSRGTLHMLNTANDYGIDSTLKVVDTLIESPPFQLYI